MNNINQGEDTSGKKIRNHKEALKVFFRLHFHF